MAQRSVWLEMHFYYCIIHLLEVIETRSSNYMNAICHAIELKPLKAYFDEYGKLQDFSNMKYFTSKHEI